MNELQTKFVALAKKAEELSKQSKQVRTELAEIMRQLPIGEMFQDSSDGVVYQTIYPCWLLMIQRCRNPKATGYANYGGRGIKICERWLHSYPNFLADMGRKPTRHYSIDRKDNDGDYEPGNCRWATRSEQNRNQRRSKDHHEATLIQT